jgi:hypothetical protein
MLVLSIIKNSIDNEYMKNRSVYTVKQGFLLAAIFLAVVHPPDVAAQSREYVLKAGYIEKFTHFIEWPELSTSAITPTVFSIIIIGDNTFGTAIEKVFNNVKIQNKKIRVTYASSLDEIDDCMILIITPSKTIDVEDIVNYAKGKPILTIGETKGYGKKGAIINMFIEDNYIRYEINQTTLHQSGLKISSLLLASAIIVKSDE